jgi:UMF1 family MFS transporter
MTPPVSRREIFGWCCYDFANSAFTTIIITVVFSRYFLEVICGGESAAYAWWGSTLAASQVGVILLAPVLGAIADRYARKKAFLAASTFLCVTATLLLGTTTTGTLLWAVVLVLIANWSFSIGESFCASFLPELSTPENVGRISGYGWSFGYFGGLASLGLALWIMYSGPADDPDRVRWVFPMTGLFFLVAALPTFLFVRERARPHHRASPTPLRDEWRAMTSTLSDHPRLLLFLFAFLSYMSGVTAVIAFASLYARDVLGFTLTETIGMFIALQLSSAAGAFAFGFFQDRIGARQALSHLNPDLDPGLPRSRPGHDQSSILSGCGRGRVCHWFHPVHQPGHRLPPGPGSGCGQSLRLLGLLREGGRRHRPAQLWLGGRTGLTALGGGPPDHLFYSRRLARGPAWLKLSTE